jgi:hypothetical protein
VNVPERKFSGTIKINSISLTHSLVFRQENSLSIPSPVSRTPRRALFHGKCGRPPIVRLSVNCARLSVPSAHMSHCKACMTFQAGEDDQLLLLFRNFLRRDVCAALAQRVEPTTWFSLTGITARPQLSTVRSQFVGLSTKFTDVLEFPTGRICKFWSVRSRSTLPADDIRPRLANYVMCHLILRHPRSAPQSRCSASPRITHHPCQRPAKLDQGGNEVEKKGQKEKRKEKKRLWGSNLGLLDFRLPL